MSNANIEAPKAKNPDNYIEQFETFVEVVKILRRECPWDKEQTNESISQLLIEETYEMLEAINEKNDKEFCKELGDVFLHVVMHAIMAEERGAFNLNDVLKGIQHKLVYRHPHVFSDVEVDGEKDVLRNWENLKMAEGRKSILEGVPQFLPALIRAQRMQFKAAKVGFDWNDKKDVWAKLEEELAELKKEILENNNEKAKEEFGDLLFSLVNCARFENIEAEEALQNTNKKFMKRFQYIEKKAAEQNKNVSDMTLKEMDIYWEESKKLEKNNL